MDITAYVLLVRDSSQQLFLADCRNGHSDIPVGFEPRYADFLFEFAESRIKCNPSDEVYLASGVVNTDDIENAANFISAFKTKLRSQYDFSEWEIIRTKKALSLCDSGYKQKLIQHLRARRIIGNKPQAPNQLMAAN